MMYKNNTEGPALDEQNKMVQELINRIKQSGISDYITRQLRAEDIGYANSNWRSPAVSATAAWTNITNTFSIPDNTFISINGVHRGYNQGTVNNYHQIRITRAGELVRIWNIEPIEDFVNNTGYFDDSIIVDQNAVLTIEGYAMTDLESSTYDQMVFLGMVAEKRGIIVQG